MGQHKLNKMLKLQVSATNCATNFAFFPFISSMHMVKQQVIYINSKNLWYKIQKFAFHRLGINFKAQGKVGQLNKFENYH